MRITEIQGEKARSWTRVRSQYWDQVYDAMRDNKHLIDDPLIFRDSIHKFINDELGITSNSYQTSIYKQARDHLIDQGELPDIRGTDAREAGRRPPPDESNIKKLKWHAVALEIRKHKDLATTNPEELANTIIKYIMDIQGTTKNNAMARYRIARDYLIDNNEIPNIVGKDMRVIRHSPKAAKAPRKWHVFRDAILQHKHLIDDPIQFRDTVINALANMNIDMPGGKTETEKRHYLMKHYSLTRDKLIKSGDIPDIKGKDLRDPSIRHRYRA